MPRPFTQLAEREFLTVREVAAFLRFTDRGVRKIIDDPRPHRVIAEAYGISKAHVGYIKRGERRTKVRDAA